MDYLIYVCLYMFLSSLGMVLISCWNLKNTLVSVTALYLFAPCAHFEMRRMEAVRQLQASHWFAFVFTNIFIEKEFKFFILFPPFFLFVLLGFLL
jgi:hypothetical protein